MPREAGLGAFWGLIEGDIKEGNPSGKDGELERF